MGGGDAMSRSGILTSASGLEVSLLEMHPVEVVIHVHRKVCMRKLSVNGETGK